jgi:hypothetical protein
LGKCGRKVSFNDVTNLVLTINQFITLIAGAPRVERLWVEKLSKVK